jgi:RNA polymerase sigma-70 factor, ECF subfamily
MTTSMIERTRTRAEGSTDINTSIRSEMLAAIPRLRVFAVSLCKNIDRADDLVQETLTRALANIHSFEPGTNMPGWLVTILRNQFHSEYRKYRHEVIGGSDSYTELLRVLPEQEGHVSLSELRAVLPNLPTDQCEALILIGALGFSYDEVAEICGCAIGTIKSRVFRARRELEKLLSVRRKHDFGSDQTMRAAL